jgi:hypothetical protein
MQNRFTLDYFGISFLLLALTAVIGFSLRERLDPLQFASGSSQNGRSDGTDQLINGLRGLGYDVRIQTVGEFQPAQQDAVLFILAPEIDFNAQERQRLNSWITQGGTLILAANNNRTRHLLNNFDLSLRRMWRSQQSTPLVLPTLNWPFVGQAEIAANHGLVLDCGQAAVHLGDCKRPFLVSFGRGNGQVYIMSSLHPFTNGGIANGRNAQLIRNIIQLNAAAGSTILVDELHRSRSALWIVETPAGWATLLTLLLLLLYAMRLFQPFGQPRPEQNRDQPEPRETAVFIKTLAEAQKELDPDRRIRAHYWQGLKRKLARRHGLDPSLADEQFLEALTPYQDQKTISMLIHLMVSMDRQQINELELQRWTTLLINLKDELENRTVDTAVNKSRVSQLQKDVI